MVGLSVIDPPKSSAKQGIHARKNPKSKIDPKELRIKSSR